MKYLIIFLISLPVYADGKYIGLVNPDTQELTDIVSDTPANRAEWQRIKGTKTVAILGVVPDLGTGIPLKYADGKISTDTVKLEAEEAAIAEEKKIQDKMREIAIAELAKEEPVTEEPVKEPIK